MKRYDHTRRWNELEAVERQIVILLTKSPVDAEPIPREVVERLLGEAGKGRKLAALLAARTRLHAELVDAHLPLVHYFAHRYAGRYEAEDLVQEGALGLLRAVEKFEHWRGYRFSTYASAWIRQAMQRAVSQKAPVVRVPVYLQERRRVIARAVERHLALRGCAPTAAELAHELAWAPIDVVDAESAQLQPCALEDHVVGPRDELPAEDELDRRSDTERVRAAVSHLKGRDRMIIESRFGMGRREATLSEIGAELGLSRERVRQLETLALARLRACVSDPRDRDPR